MCPTEAAGGAPVGGQCAPEFQAVAAAFVANFRDEAPEPEIGAAVAVYYRGEKVVDLWGGYKDPGRSRAWRASTVVNTMSVAKGIAAMCIHLLVARGRLDLDLPVAAYWPEFGQAGKSGVLLRHVLDHRAGVPVLDCVRPGSGALFDREDIVAALEQQAPLWPPGEAAGYHILSQGYVLDELVRRVDGRSMDQFLAAEIGRPLGADYRFGVKPHQVADCADTIVHRPGGSFSAEEFGGGSLSERAWLGLPRRFTFNEPEWRRAEIPSANGYGTARAVARMYSALANAAAEPAPLFPPDTVAQAVAEQHRLTERVMGRTYRQALGFLRSSPPIVPLGGRPGAFGHHGMGGSLAMGDLDARLALAYLPNRMHERADNGPRAAALVDAAYESIAATRAHGVAEEGGTGGR